MVINIIRDDITHNFSNMFFRYIPRYYNDRKTGWKTEEAISISDGIKIIDDICVILGDNLEIIKNKMLERFPSDKSTTTNAEN